MVTKLLGTKKSSMKDWSNVMLFGSSDLLRGGRYHFITLFNLMNLAIQFRSDAAQLPIPGYRERVFFNFKL